MNRESHDTFRLDLNGFGFNHGINQFCEKSLAELLSSIECAVDEVKQENQSLNHTRRELGDNLININNDVFIRINSIQFINILEELKKFFNSSKKNRKIKKSVIENNTIAVFSDNDFTTKLTNMDSLYPQDLIKIENDQKQNLVTKKMAKIIRENKELKENVLDIGKFQIVAKHDIEDFIDLSHIKNDPNFKDIQVLDTFKEFNNLQGNNQNDFIDELFENEVEEFSFKHQISDSFKIPKDDYFDINNYDIFKQQDENIKSSSVKSNSIKDESMDESSIKYDSDIDESYIRHLQQQQKDYDSEIEEYSFSKITQEVKTHSLKQDVNPINEGTNHYLDGSEIKLDKSQLFYTGNKKTLNHFYHGYYTIRHVSQSNLEKLVCHLRRKFKKDFFLKYKKYFCKRCFDIKFVKRYNEDKIIGFDIFLICRFKLYQVMFLDTFLKIRKSFYKFLDYFYSIEISKHSFYVK